MSRNGVIGKNGKIPWKLPRDLMFFKQQTLHHAIVMGRKTWNSLGNRPLPSRKNFVLTRDRHYKVEGAYVIHSIAQSIEWAQGRSLYVIGGAEIYQQFLPEADLLTVTRVDAHIEGDTYFPPVNWSKWQLVDRSKGITDEHNRYSYFFEHYERLND